MEFKVCFRSGNFIGDEKAIKHTTRIVGLKFLDQARRETNSPQLSPQIVAGSCVMDGRNPCFDLTEWEVRTAKSHCFDETTHVTVKVPSGSLNKYLALDMQISWNPQNGLVAAVAPALVIDRDQLIDDWLSAGAPLQWDPGEAEENVDQ